MKQVLTKIIKALRGGMIELVPYRECPQCGGRAECRIDDCQTLALRDPPQTDTQWRCACGYTAPGEPLVHPRYSSTWRAGEVPAAHPGTSQATAGTTPGPRCPATGRPA